MKFQVSHSHSPQKSKQSASGDLLDVEVGLERLGLGPVSAADVVAAPLVRHQLAVRLHHDRVEVLHSVVLKDIKMPNERAAQLLWVTCEILDVARRSPTLLDGLKIIGGCVNPTLSGRKRSSRNLGPALSPSPV